jgi:glycosyltransferase A (GT-A) superfamily protein (DUF2064 family)
MDTTAFWIEASLGQLFRGGYYIGVLEDLKALLLNRASFWVVHSI